MATTTKRIASSVSPYGRPPALIGARSEKRSAVRISGFGEGALIAPDAAADAGIGGRWMPRGFAGGAIGVQHGRYFEWGLVGGAYLGTIRTDGNPSDPGDGALGMMGFELRSIFGPEDWQISIHVRVGGAAIGADWDYASQDSDEEDDQWSDTGHSSDWAVAATTSAGVSFSWRVLERLSLLGGFSVDLVPYVERSSRSTSDCIDCASARGTHFPPIRYGAVPVLFVGLEAVLHPHVRARLAFLPAVSQPDDSEAAWLGTHGAVELVF